MYSQAINIAFSFCIEFIFDLVKLFREPSDGIHIYWPIVAIIIMISVIIFYTRRYLNKLQTLPVRRNAICRKEPKFRTTGGQVSIN